MVIVAILLIFLVASAVTWVIALALYQAFMPGPYLKDHPQFLSLSVISIALATLVSMFPFPFGYLAALLVWWLAARNFFEMPTGRAVVLFLLLAALTVLTRLAVLGAVTLFEPAPCPNPQGAVHDRSFDRPGAGHGAGGLALLARGPGRQ